MMTTKESWLRGKMGEIAPGVPRKGAKTCFVFLFSMQRGFSAFWLCGPAIEHRSLAGVLSLSCA